MPPPYKPVFISCASHNYEAALALAEKLGSVECFVAPRNLPLDQPFPQELFDAAVNAIVTVILLDEAYVNSPWCNIEMDIALAPYDSEEVDKAVASAGILIVVPANGQGLSFGFLPAAIGNLTPAPISDVAAIQIELNERLKIRNGRTHLDLLEQATRDALWNRVLLEGDLPSKRRNQGQFVYSEGANPASYFHGRRDDLYTIQRALCKPDGMAGKLLLTNAGGFGKTRLAEEYFWRFGPRYFPGGMVWLRADQRSPIGSLYEVLYRLDENTPELAELKGTDEEILHELKHRLKRALDKQGKLGRILWVLDNLPEPPIVDGKPQPAVDWHKWVPECGAQIAVLVTSRLSDQLVKMEHHLVTGIDPLAAARWLRASAGDHAAPIEPFQSIAEQVGCWPLALELLYPMLKDKQTTVDELQIELAKAPTKHLQTLYERLADDLNSEAIRGIDQTFAMSYALLDRKAQLLACALAHGAPDLPFPTLLFPTQPADADLRPSLARLRQRSFLTRPGTGSEGQMHAMMLDYLSTLDAGGDAEANWRGLITHFIATNGAEDPASWEGWKSMRAHIETELVRHEQWDDFEEAIASELGHFLQRSGRWLDAQGLQETIHERMEHTHGREDRRTIGALSALAMTLRRRGQLALAQEQEEEVQEVLVRVFGEEDLDALRALANLAVTLKKRGDLAGARAHEEYVYEKLTRSLGPEHPDTLSVLANLAGTRWAQGDLAEARRLEEAIYSTRKDVLGENHLDTLRCRGNLAGTLYSLGDLAGAQLHQEAVYKGLAGIQGEDHPGTLTARLNLAGTLFALQNPAAARTHFVEVYKAMEQALGAEHPDTLSARASLAITLAELGECDAAMEHVIESLIVRRRILGPTHPDTLLGEKQFGFVLSQCVTED